MHGPSLSCVSVFLFVLVWFALVCLFCFIFCVCVRLVLTYLEKYGFFLCDLFPLFLITPGLSLLLDTYFWVCWWVLCWSVPMLFVDMPYFFALFPLLIRYRKQLGQKRVTGQWENVDEIVSWFIFFFPSVLIKKYKELQFLRRLVWKCSWNEKLWNRLRRIYFLDLTRQPKVKPF